MGKTRGASGRLDAKVSTYAGDAWCVRCAASIQTRDSGVRRPDAGWPYTDEDCVRFRVDRPLIDVSPDRKNERDRSCARRARLNRSYSVRGERTFPLPLSPRLSVD